jgi:hypothetical protein
MRKQLLLGALAGGLAVLASSTAVADYATTVLSLNPAGYWKLNETLPTPQAEVATNLGTLGPAGNAYYLGLGPNAVQHNVAGATSDGDNAARFNGATSCMMAIPRTGSGLVIRPPFSVECWVYETNSTTGLGLVAAGRNHDLASSVYSGFSIQTASGGAVQFNTYARNGTTAAVSLTSPAFALSAWHHIAATYAADGVATLYVDGAQAGITTNTYFPSFAPEIQIASVLGLNSSLFPGSLDEVAIYTNALSSSEVAAHASNPSNYKDLVLAQNPIIYLRLNEPAYTPPSPGTYSVATNYGTVGLTANGAYQPGTRSSP